MLFEECCGFALCLVVAAGTFTVQERVQEWWKNLMDRW